MHISIQHLTKTYDGVTVLDDVCLEIAPGQVVAVLGQNGAGKTTLLRCLASLSRPSKGEIHYDGQLFRRERIDLRRRYFFLPDYPYVLSTMTVIRHIGMVVRLYEAERPGLEDTIIQMLRDFDLLGLAETPMQYLSRGQVYKAALIALMAADPEFWMFDEPFASGMDPRGHAAFRAQAEAAVKRGRTILYSTQILEIAERFGDRVCLLHHGKVEAFKEIAQLRADATGTRPVLEELFSKLQETGK